LGSPLLSLEDRVEEMDIRISSSKKVVVVVTPLDEFRFNMMKNP